MQKNAQLLTRFFAVLSASLLLLAPAPSEADQYGDFKYTSDGTNITITGYTGTNTSLIIPDSINGLAVTSIGSYAFYECKSFFTATIGNSVKNIGNSAFDSCNLSSITIGNGITYIDHYAFLWCSDLSTVFFEGNAPPLGIQVFNGDPKATVYYLTGSSGWNSTFGGRPTEAVTGACGDFLYLADGVNATVAGYMGYGNSVVIPGSMNGLVVNCIGTNVFYQRSNLTNVTIPGSVTNIEDYAFCDCYSLVSMVIPNSVISIGTWGFFGCTSLADVTIPNGVTAIGNAAFGKCPGLTNVTIPNSVTSLSYELFIACTNLITVTIGNSVTNIGEMAFDCCFKLAAVTIPNSVNNIEDYAFEGCFSLTNVTIPNDVTNIGNGAFSKCSSLTNATIPDSVAEIGNYVFQGCSNLASVTIGNGITNIGNYAFSYCEKLASIVFEGNAPSLGTSIFRGDYLPTVFYFVGATGWGSSFGGVTTEPVSGVNGDFLYLTNGTNMTIAGYIGFGGSASIPDLINGFIVNNIGARAFYGRANLVSVTIPNSVTNIGDYAFYNCPNLTCVIIPKSVTSIGRGAFYNCELLLRVFCEGNAPSCGSGSFGGHSVSPSTTVYYLAGTSGWGSFISGASTESVSGICGDLLYSINGTNITIACYMGSDGSVAIPSIINGLYVNKIGDRAFSWCSSLTNVCIGNSVTSIGNWAFYGSTRLISVTIGNSVTNIGSSAFYCCSSLTSIHFTGNAPTLSTNLFYMPPITTVYYLAGTTGWGATFDGITTVLEPAPTLSLQRSGKCVILSWSAGFLLETTNLVNGLWTTNSVTSPFTNVPSADVPEKFYRVQYP